MLRSKRNLLNPTFKKNFITPFDIDDITSVELLMKPEMAPNQLPIDNVPPEGKSKHLYIPVYMQSQEGFQKIPFLIPINPKNLQILQQDLIQDINDQINKDTPGATTQEKPKEKGSNDDNEKDMNK